MEESMPSKQVDELEALYRAWSAALAANPQMPLDEMRDMFEHLGDVTAEPGGVDYLETEAGGVPAMWAVPKGCVEDRVLFCTHGGGYVVCSMYTHRKLYGHIAKTIGCRALILHYRRAPEHVHPAQLDDAVAAYRWLLDGGVQPQHIAFTGDSAGGALALTTILRARAHGLPAPTATMPLSPWVDLEVTGKSMETNREHDALVQREVVDAMADMFLGNHGDRTDKSANPLYADLRGLPPMYIQVGGHETLLDDSTRLAERGRQAGVDVRLEVIPYLQHVFHLSAGRAPEADDAIRRLAEWARPRLKLS
jgi:epsilon-lactone hydrolase